MIKKIGVFFWLISSLICFAVLSGCGQQATTSSNNLTLSVKADFSRAGGRALSVKSFASYPEVFITPDRYLIALKSAKLTKTGTSDVVVLFNYPSLESCVVESFSSNEVKEIVITTAEVAAADYETLKVEVYWVQQRFPIKSGTSESVSASTEAAVMKNIRIYLTDDHAAESWRAVGDNNAHHQGDLTIIGTDEATELGWFFPPADFSGKKPRPGSPDTDGYAANQNLDKGDPTTLHDRGPNGNNDDWGGRTAAGDIAGRHPEDIFIAEIPLSDLDLSAVSKLLVRFDVKNTWVFNDVDGDGYFSPGFITGEAGDDANDETKGWGPLLPNISFEAF
ncbi:hypothetical protein A3H38_04100 [candidate division WOR-1 bacterium RIFCSPLOWO2_02_FULL_46_20]|uniref:Glucodextranase-like C-terminal domain-containing protein n=1 Tax=candidate division WOR-1 bacterium RIFCSPLOWO2_02_FULL_46_20 TaxID=1802567 RepID=A0A1F4RHN2_UNCSA|nr:MAG: hypothetical protein A3J44_01565 [candidate division WOR-1 bacterium RIFCSPHIGHO2_02_FULL_45_12]OGC07671.1 MAG: hypothetical protein A3H38_04100 [candidate division WOR-1 bacterium RIFCSPLOWO2_02_FULL_46_20]